MPDRSTALIGLIVVATAQLCQAYEWQVRRAHVTDHKEEWSAAGYEPKWEVTFNEAADGFRIDGDKDGTYRGTLLVGAALRVPSPLPASVKIRLRYQTFCAMDDPPRSGVPAVALFAPDTWAQFEETTSPALKFDYRSEAQRPLFYAGIGVSGEDVTDWKEWESPELRPKLRPHEDKPLVLAFVWSAFHYHAEEWAAVDGIELVTRDEDAVLKEFYESFDLTRPELVAVSQAVEQSEWQAAASALAAHYRHRLSPPPPGLATRGSTEAADRICDHEFQLAGCPPHKLGAQIKWNEDPFDYDQWAIALNRHSHWITLGAAYAGTKEEKYAREFVAQLRSWIDAMPVYIGAHWVQGPFGEAGKSPLSLDAGIRMGQTWFPAMYYFLTSPSFADADLVAMVRSFRDHALYLMDPRHFKAGSNWGAMEANGLLHLGCLLPEFKDASTWRDTALQRLHAELDNQVYPDGAQVELAPGYHGVTLSNMLGAVEVARRCEVALPQDFIDKLERMFDYYVRVADPARRMPALNDSGAGGIGGWLSRGLELFPERADFRYLLTDGKEGKPPDFTSTRLPYAGWHLMRSGWARDDCYLLFDAGPFGTGHQHEDKLSFIVHAFGRSLIPDAGNYSYDNSPWRRYVLSTRAHNTVMVDGLDQRHGAVRESWKSDQPVEAEWVTSEAFDFASAEYLLGYGRQESVSVEHRRSILFVKPRLWLVIDELRARDDSEHRYEALFHLDAPEAAADPQTGLVVTKHPEGPNVALVPVQSQGWRVDLVQGQEEPTVQGWLPTGKHNDLRPLPTAVYQRTAPSGARLAILVAPLREGDTPPAVSSLAVEEDSPPGSFAARLVSSDGQVHTVLWNAQPGKQVRAGQLTTTSRVALWSDTRGLVGQAP